MYPSQSRGLGQKQANIDYFCAATRGWRAATSAMEGRPARSFSRFFVTLEEKRMIP